MKYVGRALLGLIAVAGAWNYTQGQRAEPAKRVSLEPVQEDKAAQVCVRTPPFAPAPQPPHALNGRLGLWVAKIDPRTLQPIRAVANDPDGLYPLASSYKQAVLWALLKQVDAGQVQLSETFDVTTGNQSLGNYPYDDSNVRSLATRMIHNSDNTATDILHHRVGFGAVQAVADELNLCSTRLILPTKHWWVAQTGLHPEWPGAAVFAGAKGEEREKLARELDAVAQSIRADRLQIALNDYFEQRYDATQDTGTHNVSTPYEFGTLLAHQFLKPGLSAGSREMLRDVMATGYGRQRIGTPNVYFGGKGGNGWKILTMTGYLETPGGDHIVYVYMQHGSHEDYTTSNRQMTAVFSWINASVREVLREDTVAGAAGTSN